MSAESLIQQHQALAQSELANAELCESLAADMMRRAEEHRHRADTFQQLIELAVEHGTATDSVT